jgi:hypothetical protein
MSTHVQVPQAGGLSMREVVSSRRRVAGAEIGAVALGVFAAPVVIYDWARSSHSALELPMAVTGWLFGLEHFVQNDYRWGSIAVGAVILAVVWLVGGLAFGAIADRELELKSLAASIVDGAVWGVAALVLAGVVTLMGHGGAPFRPTAVTDAFAAPGWVWAVAFVASGLASGLSYAAVRRRAAR